MQLERIKPNEITFIAALGACADAGKLETGQAFHAKIIDQGPMHPGLAGFDRILMGHTKELVVELPRVMNVEKILFSSNTNNLECEVFGKEDQDGEWKFLGKTGREARFKLTKLRFILVKPLSGFEVSTIVSFYSKDNAQKPVEELELKYINPQKVDYQNPFKVGQLSKDTLVTKAIVRSNLRYYKFRLWGNIEYPCQWWFPMGDYDQDEPNPRTRELTIRYFDVKNEGKSRKFSCDKDKTNMCLLGFKPESILEERGQSCDNGQDIRLESIEDPLAELLSQIDRDSRLGILPSQCFTCCKKRLDWLERAFGREMLLGLPSNSTFQSSWRWETFLSKNVIEGDDKLISYIPGMELRSQDILLFMHDGEFQKVREDQSLHLSKRITRDSWFLINSVHDIELRVFEAMREGFREKFVPVGSLFPLKGEAINSTGLKESSVLYVLFGSISFMTAKQFEEITLGLEASKVDTIKLCFW
ncbi:hypothetical protein SELMODRAFT_419608 [Selaginella moellendorffii]|uniref:Uncharacterized protein n=1 Tax=Selaginella moellendorffii TaxID=88036 RepID=D8S9H1_SELML|nr:hypothetical protein SELMODRAFT_419608 [Selaginella moellendorffii]